MTMRFAAPAGLAALLALCCPAGGAAAGGVGAPAATTATAATTAMPAAAGVSRADMDPQVEPCVDFYRYACGGWMASHPVPPDQRAWNRFAALTDANRGKLRDILAADAADTANAANAANSAPAANAAPPAGASRAPPPATLTMSQRHRQSPSSRAKRAANTSMPSHRFCRRRFSSAACWLLSWLTVGTTITGAFMMPEKR